MFLHIVLIKHHTISKPRIWPPELIWGCKLCKKIPTTRQSRIKTVCIKRKKSTVKQYNCVKDFIQLKVHINNNYVSTNVFTMCLRNSHFFCTVLKLPILCSIKCTLILNKNSVPMSQKICYISTAKTKYFKGK